MKLNALSLVIASLASLSSSAVWAAHVPQGTQLAQQQHLVRGNGAEPSTLDPTLVNSGMPGDVIVNDMFEGLIIEDLDGKMVPGQAKSWSVSPDGKTITFVLKDGLKWSNGSPLTASDFVYAWQRAVNPNTGNTTGHYFTTANIVNADAIIAGDKAPDQLGVKALSDTQLEVQLSKPTPYFLSLMSVKTFFPIPQAVVSQYGEQWTRPEHIATNGAYTLVKWVPNEYVEVKRNAEYWDNANTVIEGVTYLGLASQNAELVRYQSGEIDMTNRIQLEQYQRLMKEDPSQIQGLPLLGTYLYSFNTRKAPFDNVKVRQALNMAIDRNILVDKITGQGEQAAYTLVPSIIADYSAAHMEYSDQDMSIRLKQAKQLLEEAGYDSEHPLEFTITYNTSENHKTIAIALAAMWKPLGVQVHLQNMEWKAYVSAKSLGDYQVARSWSFGDYAEPSSVLASYTCNNVENETGFCDQKFDDLLQQASVTSDKAERYALFHQAETRLADAAPVIPLYYYKQTRLVQKTLKGFPTNNPKGNIYAKDMYFIEP
ncbi:oligopeptide transport system substrate-binding protein [Vibrio xiamenensis]|uniref:Oligopeptide transport system substrate-binding protein n=1 Tax=Vibrio xiamenensis TaxID=861298 RepID=A0A1G8AQ70_9VIBR|nr:peptide ABC transporter substrate-binding protein [Vibrio xiamenensis]SDH23033.1 oligopeptide transport system substrate-binding protein [Vibrio xiamenensis]